MNRRDFLKGLSCLVITPVLPVKWAGVLEELMRSGESLADMVDRAQPGQLVIIGPGAYWSDRPINLQPDRMLVGRGVDCTVMGDWPALVGIQTGAIYMELVDCHIHSTDGRIEIKAVNYRAEDASRKFQNLMKYRPSLNIDVMAVEKFLSDTEGFYRMGHVG